MRERCDVWAGGGKAPGSCLARGRLIEVCVWQQTQSCHSTPEPICCSLRGCVQNFDDFSESPNHRPARCHGGPCSPATRGHGTHLNSPSPSSSSQIKRKRGRKHSEHERRMLSTTREYGWFRSEGIRKIVERRHA